MPLKRKASSVPSSPSPLIYVNRLDFSDFFHNLFPFLSGDLLTLSALLSVSTHARAAVNLDLETELNEASRKDPSTFSLVSDLRRLTPKLRPLRAVWALQNVPQQGEFYDVSRRESALKNGIYPNDEYKCDRVESWVKVLFISGYDVIYENLEGRYDANAPLRSREAPDS